MNDVLLLLGGLALVALSAKLTLDQAIVVVAHYGISDFFVGVVILAIGSDLPELVVSISAAVRNLGGVDTSGIILGNALGSCFGQIGLTLGIAGLVGRLTLPRAAAARHGAALIGSLGVLFVTGLDGEVTRIEGAVLSMLFILYLVSLVNDLGGGEQAAQEHAPGDTPAGGSGARVRRAWLLLAAGMLGVVVAAELIVEGAVAVASAMGVSQSFIAIAVIGIGTSIPELSISLAAIARRRASMSVGNIIGSNVLDTLLPVGLAALITPIAFEHGLLAFDLPALAVLSALVIAFFLLREGLTQGRAGMLVALYAVYIAIKISSA